MNFNPYTAEILTCDSHLPKDVLNIIASYTKDYFDTEYLKTYINYLELNLGNAVLEKLIYMNDRGIIPLYLLEQVAIEPAKEGVVIGDNEQEGFGSIIKEQREVDYYNTNDYKILACRMALIKILGYRIISEDVKKVIVTFINEEKTFVPILGTTFSITIENPSTTNSLILPIYLEINRLINKYQNEKNDGYVVAGVHENFKIKTIKQVFDDGVLTLQIEI